MQPRHVDGNSCIRESCQQSLSNRKQKAPLRHVLKKQRFSSRKVYNDHRTRIPSVNVLWDVCWGLHAGAANLRATNGVQILSCESCRSWAEVCTWCSTLLVAAMTTITVSARTSTILIAARTESNHTNDMFQTVNCTHPAERQVWVYP